MIKILKKLVAPQSKDENKARREYILNIMLTTIIFLVSIGALIISYRLLFLNSGNYQNNSLPLLFILIILTIFISLRLASHKGYSRIASDIFIFILFLLATYMGYKWGVDLPAEILFYVLAIVISGILIGPRLAFAVTILTFLTFIINNYLQNYHFIIIDRSWIYEPWGYSDITITSIILTIVATVLWLFNRELKKSEIALKNERDLLEIRVEEKTKELKLTQAKEINQIYRFAEFGKLSSGLFHDLVNPLTALMLNINKVKIDSENDPNFNIVRSEINQAIKASEKMKDFIVSVRKQINFQDQKEDFSLNEEVEEAITILNYKARKNQVEVIFNADENIIIYGDPIKFNQVITNLLSNAIDSYDEQQSNKEIIVELIKTSNHIKLTVADNGSGIKDEIINQIFEPFFTTKSNSDGLGLGLSLIKKIIEESFSGTITVSSKINNGTIFTVNLPLI